jgi:hypothetical protein
MDKWVKIVACLTVLSVSAVEGQAQESVTLRYRFFGGAQYSLDGTSYERATGILVGVRGEFKDLFRKDAEEYKYVQRAQWNEFLAWTVFLPAAAILFYASIFEDDDKDTKRALFWAGTAVFAGAHFFEVLGYRNLKRAVILRNERLELGARAGVRWSF